MYGLGTVFPGALISSESERWQAYPVALFQVLLKLPLQVHGYKVNYIKFSKGVFKVYSNTWYFLHYQHITTAPQSEGEQVDKIQWQKLQNQETTQTLLSRMKYMNLSKFWGRNCFSCKLFAAKWKNTVLLCSLIFMAHRGKCAHSQNLFSLSNRVPRHVSCVTSRSLPFTSPVTLIWKLHLQMKMGGLALEICSWLDQ